MKPKQTQPANFDEAVVSQLACPACFGKLRLDTPQPDVPHLVCTACSRAYPIIDGIPVLIVERAESGVN
jgi:uncharacterized protein YbaR (Trm112 family)